MQLEGIHHITAITGDAPRNVDFYTRVLGLRMAAKTVNQDDPTVYHLFYADELARPGSELTFFEYPGARAGRAGEGMVHTIVWRVGDAASPPSRSATTPGSCVASGAGAGSPTTPRRPSAACPAPGPCTTWPGARPSRSTRAGRST